MPKSSKPRKRYVRRVRPTYSLMLPQKHIDGLKDMFVNIALAVEVKLPRGTCTMDDVRMMRDYLNLGTTLLYLGHHIREDLRDEVESEWNAMTDAFGAFYKRAAAGCFTCYAGEIAAMREGFSIVDEVVKEEFEREPAWVLDCFYGVTHFLEDKGHGTKFIPVDMSAVEKRINEIRTRRKDIWRDHA